MAKYSYWSILFLIALFSTNRTTGQSNAPFDTNAYKNGKALVGKKQYNANGQLSFDMFYIDKNGNRVQ
jgi:hypothetical protein